MQIIYGRLQVEKIPKKYWKMRVPNSEFDIFLSLFGYTYSLNDTLLSIRSPLILVNFSCNCLHVADGHPEWNLPVNFVVTETRGKNRILSEHLDAPIILPHPVLIRPGYVYTICINGLPKDCSFDSYPQSKLKCCKPKSKLNFTMIRFLMIWFFNWILIIFNFYFRTTSKMNKNYPGFSFFAATIIDHNFFIWTNRLLPAVRWFVWHRQVHGKQQNHFIWN